MNEKIFKTLEMIEKTEYKTSTTERGTRLVQAQQNTVKQTLQDIIQDTLLELYPSLTISNSVKGIIIELPNEFEGSIPFEVQVISKPITWDIGSEHQAYADKMKKIREKLSKRKTK